MRPSVFMILLTGLSFLVSVLIYVYIFGADNDAYGLNYIYKGGPLVILLMVLSLMLVTFIFERVFSLRKVFGKKPIPVFMEAVLEKIRHQRIQEIRELTDRQGGAGGMIVKTGIEHYLRAQAQRFSAERCIAEARHAVEEHTAREVPLLEKNLIAISTIGSISTLVGLLGTTIGMIRAFKALAQVGAPDAVQLSIGISEALINTAGGLGAAIVAIVAYNFFVNKVDTLIYELEEAGHDLIAALALTQEQTSTP